MCESYLVSVHGNMVKWAQMIEVFAGLLSRSERERFAEIEPLRDKRRAGFFDAEDWRAFGFSCREAASYWLRRVRGARCEVGELPYVECGPIAPARRRPHPESLWRW
jgi:hypothetical protein